MMLFDLPPISSFTPDLSDEVLASRLVVLAREERRILADFLVHLGEFDRRRLCLAWGFPSLFAWLTQHLRMSNASAFRRVTAYRLNLRMPAVCAYLREGRISLTKLCLLKEVLAPENSLALLEQASQMTEKEVEQLAAVLSGKTERAPKDSIRAIALRQESLFAGEGPKPLSGEVAGAATSVPELTGTSAPVAQAPAGTAPTAFVVVAIMTSRRGRTSATSTWTSSRVTPWARRLPAPWARRCPLLWAPLDPSPNKPRLCTSGFLRAGWAPCARGATAMPHQTRGYPVSW